MPGGDKMLLIRGEAESFNVVAVPLENTDELPCRPVPDHDRTVRRCRKPSTGLRERNRATLKRIRDLDSIHELRLEIEDLQTLFRVCGCGDQFVAFRRKRQRVGWTNRTYDFRVKTAFAVEVSVEVPDAHFFAMAAGCEVLAGWINRQRGDT